MLSYVELHNSVGCGPRVPSYDVRVILAGHFVLQDPAVSSRVCECLWTAAPFTTNPLTKCLSYSNMPRPLSLALCGIIKSDLQNGCDIETLKSRHRISEKKARTMKKLFSETGEVVNLHKKKSSGRPTKLKHGHVEALKGFLAEHPEACLKDMCLFMQLEFQLELTESTTRRYCKRYVTSRSG